MSGLLFIFFNKSCTLAFIVFGTLSKIFDPKKSVSPKKKKAILQKGGFLGSLLAPIASVVAPLLSTLFQ
jgi:hypothetical protein